MAEVSLEIKQFQFFGMSSHPHFIIVGKGRGKQTVCIFIVSRKPGVYNRLGYWYLYYYSIRKMIFSISCQKIFFSFSFLTFFNVSEIHLQIICNLFCIYKLSKTNSVNSVSASCFSINAYGINVCN